MNVRSIKQNVKLIELLLSKENIDIAVLGDTWLKPNEVLKIKIYNIYSHNRGYVGVAILAKEKYKCTEFNYNFNPNEFLAVKISLNNSEYTCISLYFPPT